MTTEHPAPAAGLDVHEVDDGLVVFDAATDRVHHLNPTATMVFSFCDGSRTVAEIAELVRSVWGLDVVPIDDVTSCVATLRDQGALT